MLKNILMKLFGKKIVEGAIEKSGMSKTKIIAIIAAIIYAIETLAPAFGWDIKIPDGLFELLASTGLWTLREGVDKK